MGCSKVKTNCTGQWLYCRSLWSLNWMSNCQPQPFIMSLKWCRSETIHVVHCPKTLISLYSLIMAKKTLDLRCPGGALYVLVQVHPEIKDFLPVGSWNQGIWKKVDQKPWFGGNLPWLDAKTLTSEDSGINFFAIQPVRPEIKVNAQKQVFWPKSRKYQHFEAIHMKSACPVYYYVLMIKGVWSFPNIFQLASNSLDSGKTNNCSLDRKVAIFFFKENNANNGCL